MEDFDYCCICISKLEKRLECGHSAHSKCIILYCESVCPFCTVDYNILEKAEEKYKNDVDSGIVTPSTYYVANLKRNKDITKSRGRSHFNMQNEKLSYIEFIRQTGKGRLGKSEN